METELKEAKKSVGEQKGLIKQLEQDLLAFDASQFRGEGDGAPNVSPNLESGDPSFLTEQKLLSAAVEEKLAASEQPDSTLLSIVSSQRDRFKLRNQELEAEQKEAMQTLFVVRGECEKLKADNVQLYEKIRYLQSYSANLKGGNLGGSNQRGLSAVENRYSQDYEKRLDPFTTFNKNERNRRYTNLAAFEKITLNVGQLIFGSRTARMVVFLYAMILHALVFAVLYKYSLGTTDIRDLSAVCQEQFASHMKEFHNDNTFHNAVEDVHVAHNHR